MKTENHNLMSSKGNLKDDVRKNILRQLNITLEQYKQKWLDSFIKILYFLKE